MFRLSLVETRNIITVKLSIHKEPNSFPFGQLQTSYSNATRTNKENYLQTSSH